MLRGAWALPLPFLLVVGGCVLPPAVTIANYALNGISYAATGKSLTDHAISIALNMDCALFRVVKALEICVDPVDDDEHLVMIAVLPTDENWGAGVSLAVSDDPMVLPTDLAALTADLGLSTSAVKQPPLALLESPQATMPAAEPWAEALVGALAALPSDGPRWSRADQPARPSAQQAWEPTLGPDNSWLWAANRPVRLWLANGAGDVTAPPTVATTRPDATSVAALLGRPSEEMDYRRPRAKPALARLPIGRTGDVTQRHAARALTPAPVIVSVNRLPRTLTPATVYGQILLAAGPSCEAEIGAAACSFEEDEARHAPAAARPSADPRGRRTAIVRRSARLANSARVVRRRDRAAFCRQNGRRDCRDI